MSYTFIARAAMLTVDGDVALLPCTRVTHADGRLYREYWGDSAFEALVLTADQMEPVCDVAIWHADELTEE